MSINIGDKPEMNVVNVGDEITTDQLAAIQNAQGASLNNPFLTRTNTFGTSDSAVRITQTGTGEAFRVEDSTNPDSSPFVITADGRVGIGTTTVGTNALAVTGTTAFTGNTAVTGNLTSSGSNTFTVSAGTSVPLTIQNNGTGNSFIVNDTASDSSPFVIDNTGAVVIGMTTPYTGRNLSVSGSAEISASTAFPTTAFSVSNSGTGPVLGISGGVSSGNTLDITNNGGNSGIIVRQTNTSSSSDAVKIINSGLGNSFVVEDEGTDSTPFRIANNGTVFIGGNLTFADGTTQSTAATGGGGSYDQSLNTTDSVLFAGVSLGDFGSLTVGDAISNAMFNNQGLQVADTNGYLQVQPTGIIFPDFTTQTTAAQIFDQSLNIGDAASFGSVTITDASTNLTLSGAIQFPDSTTQGTAAINPTYSANTVVSGSGGHINGSDYPHELEFVIGGTTYRVPARSI